jgi:hypothetical protein
MFPKGRKLTVVLALLVGLLLLSGPAARAGGGGLPIQPASVAQEVRAPAAFFSWAWHWMRSLWEKNGACIDPDGRCTPSGTGSTPSKLDQGPCIEPDGVVACRVGTGSTLSQPDKGACIDPDG